MGARKRGVKGDAGTVKRYGGKAFRGTFAHWPGLIRRPVRAAARSVGRGWWRATSFGVGGMAALGVVVAAACAATALAGVNLLAQTGVEGKPVDGDTAETIALAALSCPSLSGPRLSGQLMVNSGLDPSATTSTPAGGAGIAGLTPAVFTQWAPWPNASRDDPAAAIYALAHDMCDLVGHVRTAKIAGDAWENALAAYYSGMDQVASAGGVPAAAQNYVTTVSGYTAWYTKQPVTEVAHSAGAATRVPDNYLQLVLAAGTICPEVSAPRVAAQLMASSGFDANLQAANGAAGIAQFLPGVWAQYGPGSSSPGQPSSAIASLGRAMCDLTSELARLGPDPYRSALAAFRVGPLAVRQAGGVPKIPAVDQYISQVLSYTDTYARDPRLNPTATTTSTPGPATTPPPTTSTSPAPDSILQPGPIKPGTPHGPEVVPGPAGAITGPGGARRCLDVDHNTPVSGNAVQLWDCNGVSGQRWSVNSDGTVRSYDKCLHIVGNGTANGTKVQLWDCNGSAGQIWIPLANGSLFNPKSFRCLDDPAAQTANGTQLQIYDCNGLFTQVWNLPSRPIFQWAGRVYFNTLIGKVTGPGTTGKCVDVDHNTPVNGNAVQLWDCNGVSGQQWAMNSDGTIRSYDKCLDIVGNGTSNGTKVQLWDCNGAGGQQWWPQANGSLLNPQSGRCLDDPAAQTANGTQLQIYNCNGLFTQVWSRTA